MIHADNNSAVNECAYVNAYILCVYGCSCWSDYDLNLLNSINARFGVFDFDPVDGFGPVPAQDWRVDYGYTLPAWDNWVRHFCVCLFAIM